MIKAFMADLQPDIMLRAVANRSSESKQGICIKVRVYVYICMVDQCTS